MIVMKPTATEDEIQAVVERIESRRRPRAPHPRRGGDRDRRDRRPRARRRASASRARPGVDQRRADPQAVQARLQPVRATASGRVIEIGGRKIGGEHFALIAGPCTVESRDQTLSTARRVHDGRRDDVPRRRLQAAHLARTPSRASARRACGCSPRPRSETGPADRHRADGRARPRAGRSRSPTSIQIGARNMQNYPLLAEIGRSGLPGAAQARPVRRRSRSC